jgi:DNA-binding Lrp family transcriptional regulator
MHANSLAAYHSEADRLSKRAWLVLAYLQEHGPLTDRQVMQGMGFSEPNCVRPRITELVEAGKLIEIKSVRCSITGKTVRVVGLPPKQIELIAA